jgi:hypothetical protein
MLNVAIPKIKLFSGFDFRQSGNGTPDRNSAFSNRGNYNLRVNLCIDPYSGKFERMRPEDKDFSFARREGLVKGRKNEKHIEAVSVFESVLLAMINDQRLSFKIMETEVPVGLFKEFVKNTGYEITGYNVDELRKQLNNPDEDRLTYLSALDGQALAKELGNKWRFMTTFEFNNLPNDIKQQLKVDHQVLTEKKKDTYVLRSVYSDTEIDTTPGFRNNLSAVLLVMDR